VATDSRTDETRQLDHLKQDLHREFASLPPHVVDETLDLVVSGFTRASVRSFVPVLAGRSARERLRHL
jgi:hypothetical protein